MEPQRHVGDEGGALRAPLSVLDLLLIVTSLFGRGPVAGLGAWGESAQLGAEGVGARLRSPRGPVDGASGSGRRTVIPWERVRCRGGRVDLAAVLGTQGLRNREKPVPLLPLYGLACFGSASGLLAVTGCELRPQLPIRGSPGYPDPQLGLHQLFPHGTLRDPTAH